jgi:hypothetical protein
MCVSSCRKQFRETVKKREKKQGTERERGTGTPKDKDEVKRREVCECEG